MKPLIETVWDLAKSIMKPLESESGVTFDLSRHDAFQEEFESSYKFIKNNYMQEEVSQLDRHKVAAIIVISFIESQAIRPKKTMKEGETLVFMGDYYISLQLGLAYMLNRLNDKLKEKNSVTVEKYVMPEAMSCGTNYIDIMARNLYFANNNRNWRLNPLDLADRFFLLEYITLIENKIDISLLKENDCA